MLKRIIYQREKIKQRKQNETNAEHNEYAIHEKKIL